MSALNLSFLGLGVKALAQDSNEAQNSSISIKKSEVESSIEATTESEKQSKISLGRESNSNNYEQLKVEVQLVQPESPVKVGIEATQSSIRLESQENYKAFGNAIRFDRASAQTLNPGLTLSGNRASNNFEDRTASLRLAIGGEVFKLTPTTSFQSLRIGLVNAEEGGTTQYRTQPRRIFGFEADWSLNSAWSLSGRANFDENQSFFNKEDSQLTSVAEDMMSNYNLWDSELSLSWTTGRLTTTVGVARWLPYIEGNQGSSFKVGFEYEISSKWLAQTEFYIYETDTYAVLTGTYQF